MQPHPIVSREQWIEARRAHLAHEKEFTHARDRLSQERRALPWVRVDKTYVFDGPRGKETLADLFGGHSQLVVQHFMFAPTWDEGCKSCSFWADGFERMIPHLAAARHHAGCDLARAAGEARGVQKADGLDASTGSLPTAATSTTTMRSRSPPNRSSRRDKVYNFAHLGLRCQEAPGISVFYRDEAGSIFHTYSCLRPRPRHDERRLSLPRSDPARPPRGGPALSDGLAAAARPLRACDSEARVLSGLRRTKRPCRLRQPAATRRIAGRSRKAHRARGCAAAPAFPYSASASRRPAARRQRKSRLWR